MNMKKIVLFTSLLSAFVVHAQEFNLLIGTYTSSGSDGIYVYRFNAATGETQKISSVKTSNPSFLAVSPNKKFVYAVNSNDPGMVSAFQYNKVAGTLTKLNEVTSGGANPCYISIHKSGTHLVVGNYRAGNLAVIDIRKNGIINQPKQIIQHNGNSVNKTRQDKAHVHATVFSPDNNFLFVPDLGMDKLMVYTVAQRSGAILAADPAFYEVNGGAGPRHFEFHPTRPYAYLIEELTGTVSVFKYEKGKLTLLQNTSCHPMSYQGVMGSADIHVSPDGKFLYCSNRGDANSIAIFRIDQKTGMIQIAGFQPTLGVHPRNFSFDPKGNFLLVANRDSDEIVIFKVDKQSGLLEDSKQRIRVSKPVCLKWIKK